MFEARFQTFEARADRAEGKPRLAALRVELARRGVDGFIVPRADRHQNEYVAACDERLAWLTGFTGSAGMAVVLAARAAIFIDGRYSLQVGEEVDGGLFALERLEDNGAARWIEANLPAGGKLGYDPWLHTIDAAERLGKACAAAGASLVAVEENPIDAIWRERPAPAMGAIILHDPRLAGEAADAKLARIRAELGTLRAGAIVISDPHALAWTFNIRGSDLKHTPLPLGFALVPGEGRAGLYLDAAKLAPAIREELGKVADIHPPDALAADLAARAARGAALRFDQATAADALARLVSAAGGTFTRGPDPVALMKAVKNAGEIAGARAAHLRDGAALSRFLAWFDAEAPAGKLTEIDAVAALETFRRETGRLKDVSFPTIAGAGPNGAIVHYRVTRRSNRRIAPDDLFLVDSGAQYEDGTTDVTRTVIVGTPGAQLRERFTRVLKGHIAIARAVFPAGTTGAQLDSFARAALWQAGLDYDHGTGHGVGSYLGVHEGPASISKRGTTALAAGMILSNEPGYYKPGAYGIRIENLVLVTQAPAVADADTALNAFETLTLAPIDRRLVDAAMLEATETAWLDAYHARVHAALAPLVDDATRAWLARATAPIGAR
ncbi:MAG: aminopeptidase P family protein [Proteobacteria bacterium]|nr:aminopeptidase P family protein [Pseudomonadota bacterium]